MHNNPRSVIIFPEGTRSNNGKILPFKKGGLVLAMNLNMEVIPVGIIGTRTLLKNKFSQLDDTLKLNIGKPIKTSLLNYEDRDKLVKEVRDEVVKLVRC